MSEPAKEGPKPVEEVKASDAKMKTFKLNGKQVDLRNAYPLTLGDMYDLKQEGVDITQIDETNMGVHEMYKLMVHLCTKANPQVTEEDVRTMPLDWMRSLSIDFAQGGEPDAPL